MTEKEPEAAAQPAAQPAALDVRTGDLFSVTDGKYAVCVATSGDSYSFTKAAQPDMLREAPFHKLMEVAKRFRPEVVQANIMKGYWTFLENIEDRWK